MKIKFNNKNPELVMVIITIFILLPIAYYYVIRLPQIKTVERMSKATTDYYDCLEKADETADVQRAEYCRQMNKNYNECIKSLSPSFCLIGYKGSDLSNCRMGQRQLELSNELYKSSQDSCHNKYPEVPERNQFYFTNIEGKITTDKVNR